MLKKTIIALSLIFLCVLTWTQLTLGVFDAFEGKRTYFAINPSSNACIVNGDADFLFAFTGETIEIDRAIYYKTILKHFDAQLVFFEQTEDGTSYYAYSPKIRYQTLISGKLINLHVHVKNGRTVIGSPIIFGSF